MFLMDTFNSMYTLNRNLSHPVTNCKSSFVQSIKIKVNTHNLEAVKMKINLSSFAQSHGPLDFVNYQSQYWCPCFEHVSNLIITCVSLLCLLLTMDLII